MDLGALLDRAAHVAGRVELSNVERARFLETLHAQGVRRVEDLMALDDADWRCLSLPLKLRRLLRAEANVLQELQSQAGAYSTIGKGNSHLLVAAAFAMLAVSAPLASSLFTSAAGNSTREVPIRDVDALTGPRTFSRPQRTTDHRPREAARQPSPDKVGEPSPRSRKETGNDDRVQRGRPSPRVQKEHHASEVPAGTPAQGGQRKRHSDARRGEPQSQPVIPASENGSGRAWRRRIAELAAARGAAEAPRTSRPRRRRRGRREEEEEVGPATERDGRDPSHRSAALTKKRSVAEKARVRQKRQEPRTNEEAFPLDSISAAPQLQRTEAPPIIADSVSGTRNASASASTHAAELQAASRLARPDRQSLGNDSNLSASATLARQLSPASVTSASGLSAATARMAQRSPRISKQPVDRNVSAPTDPDQYAPAGHEETIEDCEKLRLDVERSKRWSRVDEVDACWSRVVETAEKLHGIARADRNLCDASLAVPCAGYVEAKSRAAAQRLHATRLAAAGCSYRLARGDVQRLRKAADALEEALSPSPPALYTDTKPVGTGDADAFVQSCRGQSRALAIDDNAVNACQLRVMDLIMALKQLGRNADAKSWWRRVVGGEVLSYVPAWSPVGAVHRQLLGFAAKPVWDTRHFPWLAALEEQVGVIRDDLRRLLASGARFGEGGLAAHLSDTVSGWTNIVLYHSEGLTGSWVDRHCAIASRTCALLQRIARQHLDPSRWNPPPQPGVRSLEAPTLVVKFYQLLPGARVLPHYGLAGRLSAQLGLDVPDGVSLWVAGKRRRWHQGKVLVWDDSYEHEVRWEGALGDQPRTIFSVVFLHPDATGDASKAS